MIKILHNAQTGERLEIEMTPEEITEFETKRAESRIVENEVLTAKAALLKKLGITEEEAKLLLA